jgi:4-diphosphocytidyl-2-C-methyl-D-erythritol kinase
VVDALASGDERRLAAALHNDLERAACDLRPDLAQLIGEGVDAGALRGLVSGSGPTCVFLCESADHARSVAGALTAADDQRVVLVAHGPVAGAHVVARE